MAKGTAVQKTNPFLTAGSNEIVSVIRGNAGLQGVSEKDFFAALESMPSENFVDITGEYRKFEPGECVTVVVTGIADMPNKFKAGNPSLAEMADIVTFKIKEDDEVKNCVNADTVFVSTCKRLQEKNPSIWPAALRIQVMELKKGANGNYLNMSISVLFAEEIK